MLHLTLSDAGLLNRALIVIFETVAGDRGVCPGCFNDAL